MVFIAKICRSLSGALKYYLAALELAKRYAGIKCSLLLLGSIMPTNEVANGVLMWN